ncbi:MAG: hypothetical protein K8H75_10830 [Sulfuricella sp.]|nr:hypothetical protein [Sulfuricella sp.]
MSILSRYCLAGLLVLLAAGAASAQDAPEERRTRQGSGEYAGPRPPENATPEERRAFWQKRSAERAKAEESGASAAGQVATPAQAGGKPEEARPGSGRPSEAQIAEWQAKREARDGKPAAPVSGHRHGGAPDKAATGKPEESARGGGRPGGMGMRGGGAVWLSDSPPMRGDGTRPAGSRGGGMGGMAMGGERSGPPVKRLWLRSGADPQKSSFYREEPDAAPEILLVTPQGKPDGEPLPPAAEGQRNLSFEMPAQGFYRLYVTTRKLQGDTLSVSVAKAEVGNFGHDGDEEERDRAMKASRVLENAAIEIVRERQDKEGPFAQIRSGTDQSFIVLQKGLPAAGARVRFVSHQGWVKEAVSDEQGRVSFQVIRDYFPPWDEFQKRFKATYLVIAEANAAEAGNYKDQPYTGVRYQATLAGSYYPSPDDYRSYAWGLGVGLLAVLFSGVAVYLYRRRRLKPFQEVRFDEKS